MAGKKSYGKVNQRNRRDESKGSKAIVIFWLVFIIVIIFVFMINAETIKNNFALFMTRVTSGSGTEEDLPGDDSGEGFYEPPQVSDQIVTVINNAERASDTEPDRSTEPPLTGETVTGNTGTEDTRTNTQTESQPQQQQSTSTQQPVQTRERVIYFTQIDRDGQILQSGVTRNMQVTDSPMTDVLNLMLAGPSTDEINRGILNLIPRNTRLLSAIVRGSTAYISFSEDFLFNTFGIEGYVAQLRQIVWTVTEFSNVADVQILVEGRRIDYLGEGVYIGSPISRQSF